MKPTTKTKKLPKAKMLYGSNSTGVAANEYVVSFVVEISYIFNHSRFCIGCLFANKYIAFSDFSDLRVLFGWAG